MKRYKMEQERPEEREKRLKRESEPMKQRINLSALAQFKGFNYYSLARDINV